MMVVSSQAPSGGHSRVDAVTPVSTSVDRTLPLCSVVSSHVQDGVYFCVNGRLCRTLLDTGADVSLVDQRLVESLSIPSVPSSGTIQLAMLNMVANKNAVTAPLPLVAVFHCPSSGGRAAEDKASYPPVPLSHSFEVIPLPDLDIQFIVGMDILPQLFGDHIPLRFCRKAPASVVEPKPAASNAVLAMAASPA